jgi:hypothetical protein
MTEYNRVSNIDKPNKLFIESSDEEPSNEQQNKSFLNTAKGFFNKLINTTSNKSTTRTFKE